MTTTMLKNIYINPSHVSQPQVHKKGGGLALEFI